MLKLCRVTNVKVLFLVLVYVFDFNLFLFSAAILEKALLLTGSYFLLILIAFCSKIKSDTTKFHDKQSLCRKRVYLAQF